VVVGEGKALSGELSDIRRIDLTAEWRDIGESKVICQYENYIGPL
jgi:hypothetical protein